MNIRLLCTLVVLEICLHGTSAAPEELFPEPHSFLSTSFAKFRLQWLSEMPEGFNIIAEISKYYRIHKDSIKVWSKSADRCLSDLQTAHTAPGVKYYVDSSARKPSGLHNGNIRWYGDFDECRAIGPMNSIYENDKFYPKFCQSAFEATYNTNESVYITIGLCVPDSCSETDIVDLANIVLPDLAGILLIPAMTKCQNENFGISDIEPYSYIAIPIVATVGFFMLVGLLFDIYLRFRQVNKKYINKPYAEFTQEEKFSIVGYFGSVALYFSPWTNLEKLLKIPPTPNPPVEPNVMCLNTIRILSLAWVMLWNFTINGLAAPMTDNLVTVNNFLEYFTYQFVISGYFAVDSFYYLGGFLCYWLLYRSFADPEEHTLVSFGKAFLHKFVKVSAPLYFLVLITLGIYPLLGDGPFYLQEPQPRCVDNWWPTLLYINNFVYPDRQCWPHTWYLMVDMQFYIVGTFVVYAFVKSEIAGWISCALILAGQISANIAITIIYNLPSVPYVPPTYDEMLVKFGGEARDFGAYYENLYVMPYCRSAPFVIGIICAHMVSHHSKFIKRRIYSNFFIQAAGWLITFGLFVTLTYGRYDVYNGWRMEDRFTECIYAAFARTAWTIALAWMTVSAIYNKAGIVGKFLNYNIFGVLGRISFCAYLTHPLVLTYFVYTTRRPYHFTGITTAYYWTSTAVICLITGTLYNISFETPFMNMVEEFVHYPH